MKVRARLVGLLAILLLGLTSAVTAEVSADQPDTNRRILVMLKLGATHYRAGADYGGSGYADAVGNAARRRMAEKIAREHHLRFVENWPMQVIGIDCVIMIVPDERPLEQVTAELSRLPGVAWSQPMNEFHMEGGPTSHNDRLYQAQPAARRWRLAALHKVATGQGVTIAVVDSGIDADHPDLNGQISTEQNFAPDRLVPERHGTGVAGVIAAHANNSVGIAGVAPGARVMGLRACWETRTPGKTVCDSISLAKALTYAIERRADVINMSLSGPNDRLIATLIGIANSRGSTVVAAVDGNRADNGFPASVKGVIPVADESLSAPRSGVYIAPGLDIPTTEPGGKWDLVNGSSYAAAHVSGLVALVRQVERSGNRGTVAAALGRSGTIDACAVLTRATPLAEDRCTPTN